MNISGWNTDRIIAELPDIDRPTAALPVVDTPFSAASHCGSSLVRKVSHL